MTSLSQSRIAVRSARVSGLSRLTGSSGYASARSLSRLAAPPRTTVPLKMMPCTAVAARSFTATSAAYSRDSAWQSKGTVKYTELKPETEAPSGDITIIDVREPSEVAQGIIPSAVNVPLSQFQQAFSDSGGDFVRNFAFDRPGYDDKIIFYCRSGKRSQQAIDFAQKNGWWNTRNYEGSWLDWVQQEEARGQTSKVKEDDD